MTVNDNSLPASKLFHRALITLIPACGLSIAAYDTGFAWYFVLPAIGFWVAGIWYLKRGAERLNQEQH
jgi:hypothetical protein